MTAQPTIAITDESPARAIHQQLRGLIASGVLGANERLPTVRQAALDLGVSPGTVAKAYKMLEHDGLVVSRTAAGTRVAPTAALLPNSVLRLIRSLADEGQTAGVQLEDVIGVLRTTWSASPAETHRNS